MTERKDPRVKLWTAWPDASVEMLKQLWREKNSASVIAEELTRQTGRNFTCNAIIGKINRLGLQGEGSLAPKFTKSKKRKAREEKQHNVASLEAPIRFTPPVAEIVSLDLEFPSVVEIAEEVDLPISGRVTLSDVGPGICRYPIGDPLATDFTFCGDACDIARPYCPEHHRLCYTPITKQRQVAWRARQ